MNQWAGVSRLGLQTIGLRMFEVGGRSPPIAAGRRRHHYQSPRHHSPAGARRQKTALQAAPPAQSIRPAELTPPSPSIRPAQSVHPSQSDLLLGGGLSRSSSFHRRTGAPLRCKALPRMMLRRHIHYLGKIVAEPERPDVLMRQGFMVVAVMPSVGVVTVMSIWQVAPAVVTLQIWHGGAIQPRVQPVLLSSMFTICYVDSSCAI